MLWKNIDTDDNVANAYFVLVAQGYRLTLRICNNYCLSTIKMVSRTLLRVTLILILPVLLVLPRDFGFVLDAITIGLRGLLKQYPDWNCGGCGMCLQPILTCSYMS